jgi:hypothetical protein
MSTFPLNLIKRSEKGAPLSATDHDSNLSDIEGMVNSISQQETSITLTVGSGGDYTTLNAAVKDAYRKYKPIYDNTGITVTINLLSGFTLEEQVLVRGLNLGWITITGEDAETIIDNTSLTVNFTTTDYGFSSYPAFGVSKGGTLPRIDQLFRFDVAGVGGEKHGVMAIGAGSSAEITASKGVKNAGTHGIVATRGSTINASSANASGAGNSGIFATQGSTINAGLADATGSGTYGIYATRGSTINASSANASGAGTHGIFATRGSTINAESADASGADTYGIFAALGSTINAESADASGAGTYGIYAINGSTINASSALIQNQTTGTNCIKILNGSTIIANGVDTSGSTVPILSQTANTLTSNGIIYQ